MTKDPLSAPPPYPQLDPPPTNAGKLGNGLSNLIIRSTTQERNIVDLCIPFVRSIHYAIAPGLSFWTLRLFSLLDLLIWPKPL